MLLDHTAGFENGQWQPFASPYAWQLRDPGQRIVPRTVYARFRNAQNDVCTTGLSDDIVYDPLPPTVSVSVATRRSAGELVPIRIQAADQSNGSGVHQMQMSYHADFADAGWVAYTSGAQADPALGNTLYVRVRDRAGNASDVASVAVVARRLFLPQVGR